MIRVAIAPKYVSLSVEHGQKVSRRLCSLSVPPACSTWLAALSTASALRSFSCFVAWSIRSSSSGSTFPCGRARASTKMSSMTICAGCDFIACHGIVRERLPMSPGTWVSCRNRLLSKPTCDNLDWQTEPLQNRLLEPEAMELCLACALSVYDQPSHPIAGRTGQDGQLKIIWVQVVDIGRYVYVEHTQGHVLDDLHGCLVAVRRGVCAVRRAATASIEKSARRRAACRCVCDGLEWMGGVCARCTVSVSCRRVVGVLVVVVVVVCRNAIKV